VVFWLCVDKDEIKLVTFAMSFNLIMYVACSDLNYCLLCCFCEGFDEEEGKCFYFTRDIHEFDKWV